MGFRIEVPCTSAPECYAWASEIVKAHYPTVVAALPRVFAVISCFLAMWYILKMLGHCTKVVWDKVAPLLFFCAAVGYVFYCHHQGWLGEWWELARQWSDSMKKQTEL
jgi:hypothetical protein